MVVTTGVEGMLLVSSEWRKKMLLKTQQCTGLIPTANNNLAYSVHAAKVENLELIVPNFIRTNIYLL